MNDLKKLGQPWSVSWSETWWRGLLVIIIYFVIRTAAEISLMLNNLPDQSVASVTEALAAMTANPILFLLKEIALVLLVLLLLKLFQLPLLKGLHFEGDKVKWTLKIFVFMYLLEILFSGLVTWLQPEYAGPDNQAAVESMLGVLPYPIFFFMVVIAAPIVEEIICRGMVMTYILPKYPWVGALVAVLFFVFLHGPANITDYMTYFILSLGITFVYLKTRRIEYAIMVHMLQNFIAAIAMLFI